MVWQDPFDNKNQPSDDVFDANSQPKADKNLRATIWDRVAAFNLDLLIVFPFIKLMESPLELYYSRLTYLSDLSEWKKNMLFTLLSFSMFFMYQLVCLIFQGATLGMKVFHLQLVAIGNNGLAQVSRIYLRTLVFYVEFVLCIGLPLWFVFINRKRKTIHDLVSETKVICVSIKERAPDRVQTRQWMMGALFHIALVGVCIANIMLEGKAPEDEKCHIAKLEKLDDYLSLYFLGKVDELCLREVGEAEIWKKGESAEAYLALSIATIKEPETSDLYLEEICREDKESIACRFSNWVVRDEASEDESFWSSLDEGASLPDYMIINKVGYLMKKERWSEALQILPSLAFHKDRSEFVQQMSFKAHIGAQNWFEAYNLVVSAEHLNKNNLSILIKNAFHSGWSDRVTLRHWIELHWDVDSDSSSNRNPASASEDIMEIYKQLGEP